MRGVLNVCKPSGVSSYDVIRMVKPLLPPGTPIGHAGTLDPLASGVLLLLTAEATKISRCLLGLSKEYEAVVLFGLRTDTDDVTGRTVGEAPVPELSPDEWRAALLRFTGEITQVPPSFSALKKDGRPLYELARSGNPVQPRERKVTIHALQSIDWTPPRLRLRALVSSGTYIRALARDLGGALGSAATLEGLVRTAVGKFKLVDAVALDGLDAAGAQQRIVPVTQALEGLPLLRITGSDAVRLRHGQPVPANPGRAGLALAETLDGGFLALVECSPSSIRTERVIYAD